ncbi:lactate utilization protein C [Streptomyces sp. NPDC057486]|uniref:LutC/YkgG family protein n=1 Tax=Streptomyces sp. NPDC057486 TaxID=3346145 RepID=UPI0036BB8EBD
MTAARPGATSPAPATATSADADGRADKGVVAVGKPATENRAAVLGRVRAALSDVPADETPDMVPISRAYLRSHAHTDPVDLFAARVADYGATVGRCGPAEVTNAIGATLADWDARRIVLPPGFPADWLPDGVSTVADDPPLSLADLDSAHATVTTAAVAIAITGTVVLDAGPGQGRRVLTLVPDRHLSVVRGSQIMADVPDALAALDPARPLTFVSGPSATSDIELSRVEGVHGRRAPCTSSSWMA